MMSACTRTSWLVGGRPLVGLRTGPQSAPARGLRVPRRTVHISVAQLASESLTAKPRRVGIIGAGIGGLTLAHALDVLDSGAESVKVFDRRDVLEPTLGGSLNMNSGAVIFGRLGLGDEFQELANPWQRLVSRSVEGTELVRMEVADALATASDPDDLYFNGKPMSGAVMRGDLQAMLAEGLPPGTVQLGKELVSLDEGETGVTATFSDGSAEEFDLVVGCDGIRSTARLLMFGSNAPKFSGVRVRFGVASGGGVRTGRQVEEVHQWFGDGAYTLCLTAVIAVCQHVDATGGDENPNWDASEARGDALRVLRDLRFPQEVQDLCEGCDRFFDLGVHYHDPMPAWRPQGSGRMVLLGDACHAMPPFLGQGANQAAQDAYSLALKLAGMGADYRTVGEALDAYYGAREPPSTALMQSSRGMGFIETLGGPIGTLVRNTGIFAAGVVGVPKLIFSSGATPRV